MKKIIILLSTFLIIFNQSLSCYSMSNKSALDDIKYEYYNVIKKNLSKYHLQTKTNNNSGTSEISKVYSDNGYIKFISRSRTSNSGKYIEEVYITDNGNKFLYTEEHIKAKVKQKRYYYNNCGELIRYIDENGRQSDY